MEMDTAIDYFHEKNVYNHGKSMPGAVKIKSDDNENPLNKIEMSTTEDDDDVWLTLAITPKNSQKSPGRLSSIGNQGMAS